MVWRIYQQWKWWLSLQLNQKHEEKHFEKHYCADVCWEQGGTRRGSDVFYYWCTVVHVTWGRECMKRNFFFIIQWIGLTLVVRIPSRPLYPSVIWVNFKNGENRFPHSVLSWLSISRVHSFTFSLLLYTGSPVV